MMTIHPMRSTKQQSTRRGVTLTEVLVSLAVMSIGVVAVATLFPLSVLRTVQATQLTNAAQLRYNFEGMAGARPEIFAGSEAWQAGKVYAVGDIVVGSIPSSFFFECTVGGTAGSLEPNWANLGLTVTDGGVTWITRGARVFVVDPLGWQNRTEEMRDYGQTPSSNTPNNRNAFGRKTIIPPVPPATNTVTNPNYPGTPPYDSAYRIVRFRGGVPGSAVNPSSMTSFPAINSNADIAAKFGARQMAVLPDSWTVQTDSTDLIVPAAPVTSLQLTNSSSSLIPTLDRPPTDGILNFVVGTGAEQDISARVTLYDATGKYSYIRQLTGITSPSAGVEELAWTGALPAGFIPVRARVETFEARYSWMLTGRRNGPTAYMNLVVFFRRSSDPEDELIHPAHFHMGTYPGPDGQPGVTGVDDDGKGGVDNAAELGWPGSDDVVEPTVVIKFSDDLPAPQRPFLKRGGFVCDSQNNRWYRVLSFRDVPDAYAALQQIDGSITSNPFPIVSRPDGAVVKLDNAVLENSGIYNPEPTAASSFPGAILMPGIIDIYPLQPRLPWEN
ncbi:MAG: prepilin-type N-terminal cleavage/methylation domain-containing protein [Planctomycetaceae bacterium]|nr:prepilin-type N-terminal cleavage/methylation domain-containing protein [Planctomycetaceae bacterium]